MQRYEKKLEATKEKLFRLKEKIEDDVNTLLPKNASVPKQNLFSIIKKGTNVKINMSFLTWIPVSPDIILSFQASNSSRTLSGNNKRSLIDPQQLSYH